jgi:flagellar M-ring protein FliF
MALINGDNLAAQIHGFGQLPIVRQFGLLFGLAASIALGFGVVMWAQTPDYRPLYSNISEQEVVEITQALDQSKIPYRLGDGSDTILVPAGDIHNARLQLASEGLPRGAGAGFELLQQNSGFGTSQFMETARYQTALEGELGRTISSLSSVQSARVHLAIPKQSVFVRNRKKPSASVLVHLFPGRVLDQGNIGAIVHLVASSIPNLDTDNVAVVDQNGKLLTSPELSSDMRLSASQFDYRKQFENYFIKRIETILEPIVGAGGVKAQVVADLDFTSNEQTQESYNPDKSVVRSEQILEEQTSSGLAAIGVPGALSNQPPPAGVVGQDQTTAAGQNADTNEPVNSTKRATRNYELNKTISHTRSPSVILRRLSLAVVVDDRKSADQEGKVSHTARTQEELDRITKLVKEAVGFDAQRGDTVSVINSSFAEPPQVEELPETPFWKQPWIWDAGRILLAGGLVLLLVFGVLRPVLRELAAKGVAHRETMNTMLPAAQGQGAAALAGDHRQMARLGETGAPQLSGPGVTQDPLTTARTLAAEDPKRVAQVVKNWVTNDGQ